MQGKLWLRPHILEIGDVRMKFEPRTDAQDLGQMQVDSSHNTKLLKAEYNQSEQRWWYQVDWPHHSAWVPSWIMAHNVKQYTFDTNGGQGGDIPGWDTPPQDLFCQ